MKITPELVMSWRPCEEYTEPRIRKLIGDGVTPLEACDLGIPAEDRLWALCRQEVMDARTLRLLACRWAESAFPFFERDYPDNSRPHNAIAVARRFANGDATDNELAAASDAARAAASAAARAAASDAAWAAASDAFVADMRAVLSGTDVESLPRREAEMVNKANE